MAQVEEVKVAVGEDDALAGGAPGRAPLFCLFQAPY
jgi:hypothetical protein